MNLASIKRMVKALPEPESYYEGVSGIFVSPPRRVLAFHRQHRKEVAGEGLQMHSRFVLCVWIRGAGVLSVDGQPLPIAPGEGVLLFPFQQHHFSRVAQEELLWLFVSFDLEEEGGLSLLRNVPFALSQPCWEYVARILDSFLCNRDQRGAKGGDIISWLCLLLIEMAAIRSREEGSAEASVPIRGNQGRYTRRASEVVFRNLARPLAIRDIAKEVHCSESHLRRVFREEMGSSLGRFMLQARINHACALLETTGNSIGEVADACGFSSVYAFSRTFRREMGLPPSAYGARAKKREMMAMNSVKRPSQSPIS